ncbi:MAG TPA: hypothetical protein VMR25_15200, partial [Planctomycetaceae bacterium]|nr:hypothetical protein [Planctomycetaceae bacterium]
MVLLHWLSGVRLRAAFRLRYRRKRARQWRLTRTTSRFGPAVDELEVRLLLTPTISLPGAQTIEKNAPLTLSGANAVSVADAGANGGADQVTLTAGEGTLTLGSTPGSTTVTGNGTNAVVLSDTIANLNTALNGLTYTPTSGFVGSDSIGVTIVDDGNGGPQTANASLSVTLVAPTIAVTGGTTLNYTQGSSAAAIDPSLTLSDVSSTLTEATVAITSDLASNEDV